MIFCKAATYAMVKCVWWTFRTIFHQVSFGLWPEHYLSASPRGERTTTHRCLVFIIFTNTFNSTNSSPSNSRYYIPSVFLSFCYSMFLLFCLSVFLSFCLSTFLSFSVPVIPCSCYSGPCYSGFLLFCVRHEPPVILCPTWTIPQCARKCLSSWSKQMSGGLWRNLYRSIEGAIAWLEDQLDPGTTCTEG